MLPSDTGLTSNSKAETVLSKLKDILRPIRNRIRDGSSARVCPICENESKKFLEFGIIPRPDAKCPCCASLERHRLFWLYWERVFSGHEKPPKNALHVAPEKILEQKLRPAIGDGYLTADLLDPNVDVTMDITEIQFPDNSFDFIYCSHVLEHVLDDRKAMREFHRVLTHDGIAILLVPITAKKTIEDPSVTDPEERLRIFGQADHVRRYGPDYSSRLQDAGFTVKEVRREDFLNAKEIRKMGITISAGVLYICKKSTN